MRSNEKSWLEAFLTVFCPTSCCLGVGLIAYGTQVLAPRSGFFQLTINAMIVGILVLIARRWPMRRFLAAGILITAVVTAMAAHAGPRIMLHTVVLLVMWVGVVLVNVGIFSPRQGVRMAGQYVVWSLVFAVGLFGAGVVLMVFFGPVETTPHLVHYGMLAALSGVGLGIGFKVQDWLVGGLRFKSGALTCEVQHGYSRHERAIR